VCGFISSQGFFEVEKLSTCYPQGVDNFFGLFSNVA